MQGWRDIPGTRRMQSSRCAGQQLCNTAWRNHMIYRSPPYQTTCSVLDPVAAIKDMYRQFPTRTSDDPFLMLPDRSPFTTRLSATALHSILRECGFPADNYSLHSLLRDGAFRAGAAHGTCRSDCVWDYITAHGASESSPYSWERLSLSKDSIFI